MTTPSVFCLSRYLRTSDGVVLAPEWSEHLSRELLRALRMARPAAPDAYDEECPIRSGEEDFAIAARLFHEVLTLNPAASAFPVFAAQSFRSSLFKAAVQHAQAGAEVLALCSLDESRLKLAANVARWMLRMEQQSLVTVVFVPDPPAPDTAHRHTAQAVA